MYRFSSHLRQPSIQKKCCPDSFHNTLQSLVCVWWDSFCGLGILGEGVCVLNCYT